MNYKLGYIANRVGVPSLSMQVEKLIEHGLEKKDIFESLDDCLASLRDGDTLVLYTTAILGRNKIDSTFVHVAENGASGIYSIKTKRHYDCQDQLHGFEILYDARQELEIVTKKHIAEVGRQLGGRKKDPIWGKAGEIRQSRNEGVSFKELSEIHGTSEATIRRILQ